MIHARARRRCRVDLSSPAESGGGRAGLVCIDCQTALRPSSVVLARCRSSIRRTRMPMRLPLACLVDSLFVSVSGLVGDAYHQPALAQEGGRAEDKDPRTA